MVSTLKRPRRVYLHKRLIAGRRRDRAIESVWRAKQEAETGTALPATFPSLVKLTAIGYTTEEDLDGADTNELRRDVGLTQREADAVLLALAPLLL